MLKFLMKNALFDPASAARHIEHCAVDGDAISNSVIAAAMLSSTNLLRLRRINVPRRPVAAL